MISREAFTNIGGMIKQVLHMNIQVAYGDVMVYDSNGTKNVR